MAQMFEWQVLEEEAAPLEALEWEEPLPVSRDQQTVVVTRPARRLYLRQWLVTVFALLFVIGLGLVWWRTRAVSELVRRDVQQVVSREALAWQTGDGDEFEAVLDREASSGWRNRELRRFRWLQTWWPEMIRDEQARVESVVLLGDLAEARVRYQSAASGAAFEAVQFFRRLSPEEGWRRTAPDPDRWGARREADTAHFHFVYRERDRAAVEAVIPEVEAFYAGLRRDLAGPGTSPASSAGLEAGATRRITVTIEPKVDVVSWRMVDGSISLVSPELQLVPAGSTPDVELRRALARPLIHSLIDAQVWTHRLPPEGRDFAHTAGDWLADAWSGAPSWGAETQATVLAAARDRGEVLGVEASRYWSHETYVQLWHAHNYYLAGYVAERYGRGAFMPLLQAWQTGRSWSEVVPAALGVSYPDFEAGWQAYLNRLGEDRLAARGQVE